MNKLGSARRFDGAAMPDMDAPAESTSSDTSTIVGYLTSLAMTAIATAIAVGIDSQVTIPNLSLLFVVPVIVAAGPLLVVGLELTLEAPHAPASIGLTQRAQEVGPGEGARPSGQPRPAQENVPR